MRLRVYVSANSIVPRRLEFPLRALNLHSALYLSLDIALSARKSTAADHVLFRLSLFSPISFRVRGRSIFPLKSNILSETHNSL